MTQFTFAKATKKASRLRLALIGPPSGGKTYTALRVARAMLPEGRIALIDTERGSASKYADLFEFDVLELLVHSPQNYVAAIQAAEKAGYDAIIIDSLSHAWSGVEGALEQVDRVVEKQAARGGGGGRGNSFSAWKEVTPLHTRLIDTITQCRMHVFATLRAKIEWVIEEDDRGKKVPRKIGLAPVMRDGIEYEFDVVGYMDPARNTFAVEKSRCPALSGGLFEKPGEDVAVALRDWLSGEAVDEEAEAVRRNAAREAQSRSASTVTTQRATNVGRAALAAALKEIGKTWPDVQDVATNACGRIFTEHDKPTDDEMLRIAQAVRSANFDTIPF